MSTVASTSFLPLLASTMPGVTLNLGEVQRLEFTSAQASALAERIREQRIGDHNSAFYDLLNGINIIRALRGGTSAKKLQGLVDARNSVSLRLQLDASIAAAHVVGKKGRISKKLLGVLGPHGEGVWDLKDSRGYFKFDNPKVEVSRAVGARGPLGRAEIRDVKTWASEQGIVETPQSILDAAQEQAEGNSLRAAQLFFLSALLLQGEWKQKDPTGSVPPEISERLMWSAENLYLAGQRRPANQYLGDVIGLRLAAVQLSSEVLKGRRLAALQEAVGESLEPRAEEARSKEPQLIASALYWLDAAANWNNTRREDEAEEGEEAEFALRAFNKGFALLQRAGRLPVQAG